LIVRLLESEWAWGVDSEALEGRITCTVKNRVPLPTTSALMVVPAVVKRDEAPRVAVNAERMHR
jgi:hypothetical protein